MKVAVYGTLKQGRGNHFLLSGKYEGKPAIGTLLGYEMRSVGPFPFIRKSENPESSVHVEVYDIPDHIGNQVMRSLDWLEGYDPDSAVPHYIREQLDVTLGDGSIVRAYVYTGDSNETARSSYAEKYQRFPLVESGRW